MATTKYEIACQKSRETFSAILDFAQSKLNHEDFSNFIKLIDNHTAAEGERVLTLIKGE